MQAPSVPENEHQRLAALRSVCILDTLPEERFDRITRIAANLFGVPISLVSIVDEHRQWFKSKHGLEACETSREVSFCGHTILSDEIFVVEDTEKDPRFIDNPLVTGDPNIRFYAGCPIRLPEGHTIGTLCLIDREPKNLSDNDKVLLGDLAAIVEQELKIHCLNAKDELTGLENQQGFTLLGEYRVRLCKRLQVPMSLVIFRLDRFKDINVAHGYAEGDHLLRVFALVLKESLRCSDVIARTGGDSFAVLLTGIDEEFVQETLSRISYRVKKLNHTYKKYKVSYSIGLLNVPGESDIELTEMLRQASDDLQHNKNS